MLHRQPSLNALRIFKSVMQHQSIKIAADELCLTPQAVSHQIKQLEQSLGQELFGRLPKGIQSTEIAHVLNMHVCKAFDTISEGVKAIEQLNTKKLYLHVSPYFSSNYLIPRLNDFTRTYPEIDLRIAIGADVVNFSDKKIDVAVYWGYQGVKGFKSIPLIDDLKVMVCRQHLLDDKPLHTASDLLKHTLISPLVGNSLWSDAFELLGLDKDMPRNEVRLHTNRAMLDAALAGMGIAFVSYHAALEEIEKGRLVAPLGMDVMRALPAARMPKFYILLPEGIPQTKLVDTFVTWLQTTFV